MSRKTQRTRPRLWIEEEEEEGRKRGLQLQLSTEEYIGQDRKVHARGRRSRSVGASREPRGFIRSRSSYARGGRDGSVEGVLDVILGSDGGVDDGILSVDGRVLDVIARAGKGGENRRERVLGELDTRRERLSDRVED
jgi:hypothetical protein